MLLRNFIEPRFVRAPEDDEGADPYPEDFLDGQDVEDDLPDPDADDGDGLGGDEDGGDEDRRDADADREDDGSQDHRSSEVRRPSRAQQRIEALAREAKETKAELERLKAERQNQDFQRQQRETQAQEQERLSLMDPEDRTAYLLQKQEQQNQARYAALEFKLQDSADRTEFKALASRNAVAAKLEPEVEKYLAEMRRNGTNAPRETILRYVIGDRALANAGRAKGKATAAAAGRRAQQSARPTGGRSDVSSGTSRGGDDRSKRASRLSDIEI